MKKARAALFILILSEFLMLSGCWDYNEINELAIVNGLAVDKDKDGSGYSITVEIVDLRGAGKEAKIQSKKIESEGKTFDDALRNVVKVSAKKLYWSHAEIVIISQEVAKQGILPVLDLVNRLYQARLTINILVSKSQKARELLSQQSITTDIRSIELRQMIDTENRILSKAPHVDVRGFINDLAGEGVSATLPMVGIIMNEGRQTSELSGTAIFRADKFIGALSEEDTKFMLFVKNKVKGGLLLLHENMDGYGDEVSLNIKENNTKVTPVFTDGKLTMNVNVDTKVGLSELGVEKNYIEKNGREMLKTEVEKTIKTNIENVINKVKSDYNADIFGFGSTVMREMPTLWKRIGPDWHNIFRKLPVNVRVEVEIKTSGLSSKPVKIGD